MKKLFNNKIFKIVMTTLNILLIVAILALVSFQRIFDNKVSLAGYRMFTIITESMIPVYEVNDVIFSKEIKPEDIEVGDDLVYLGKEADFADKIVTHRVIEIEQRDGKYFFYLKGVANTGVDPVVEEDQIYGKVVYKSVVLSFLSGILNHAVGFYFLIFVPLTVLIALEIIDRTKTKEIEEKDGEEKE